MNGREREREIETERDVCVHIYMCVCVCVCVCVCACCVCVYVSGVSLSRFFLSFSLSHRSRALSPSLFTLTSNPLQEHFPFLPHPNAPIFCAHTPTPSVSVCTHAHPP